MEETTTYGPLIAAMDRYGGAQNGTGRSPRHRAIKALTHENTLERYVLTAGKWVAQLALAGGNRRNHVQQNAFFGSNTVDNSVYINVSNNDSQKKKEKEEGESQRVGFLTAAGIATLFFGGVAATSYSAHRLWEVSQAKRDVEQVKADADKLPMYLYYAEAEDCRTKLCSELEEAHYALTKDQGYYLATTIATALLMVGIGSLAYDKLIRRSYAAYQAMVASWLASATTFGVAVGFLGLSGKERRETVEFLYTSYEERRVYTHQQQGTTRYQAVQAANLTSPTSIQPSAPSADATETYVYQDSTGYVRFEPFPTT